MSIRFDPHDNSPVVVVANRDELYARPSAPPSAIGVNPRIFAPRDLEAGGTWIGINEWGLVAAITNVWLGTIKERDRETIESTRSRGLLTLDALHCKSVEAALNLVREKVLKDSYQFFNLLLVNTTAAVIVTYTGKLTEHMLTSHYATILNTPYHSLEIPSDRLPSFPHVDGEPEEWLSQIKELLSQHPEVCKHSEKFGTRSSQVIVLSRQLPDIAAPVFSHRFWYADGPPCKTDFIDFSSELQAALQRSLHNKTV